MFGVDHGGWMLGGGAWMMLWWLLPIALVIGLFAYFGNLSAGRGTVGKTALDILKERYARGDIGEDEYKKKARDISS